jgi:tellurite resistance protein
MGHKGDRDTINNVMAACTLHARSTDDLSSSEWEHLPQLPLMTKRDSLAAYVKARRVKDGWNMDV